METIAFMKNVHCEMYGFDTQYSPFVRDIACFTIIDDKQLQAQDVFIEFVNVSSSHIARLKRRHLGIHMPTNVLAVTTDTIGDKHDDFHVLGTVFLCLQFIRTEARSLQKACFAHLAHLTIHGVLHLIGYDHTDMPSAKYMAQAERRILESLAILYR